MARTKIRVNAPKTIKEKKTCVGCKNDYVLTEFYSADELLFPDGRFHQCKKCVEGIIESRGFNGFIMILRAMNKPFFEDKFKDDWKSYITQLNSLPQYKGKTFDHSVFKNSKHPTLNQDVLSQDFHSDYKDEEKYYSQKWMGEFSKSDIDYLESYYAGLDRDFKIVTTNHKDYAKKICKASLHMDKCFADMLNGVAGTDSKYKSARETFDTLSKSAQFSESQRGQNDVSLGCFGVTFDMVEQNMWIPKNTPMEPDDIDKLLEQFGSIRESI